MKNLVLYLHGKGGSARESEHYKPLFPGCEVLGLDYRGAVPWEAGPEIRAAVDYVVPASLERGSTGSASQIIKVGLGGEVEIIRP